jgi:hypothetical protein
MPNGMVLGSVVGSAEAPEAGFSVGLLAVIVGDQWNLCWMGLLFAEQKLD